MKCKLVSGKEVEIPDNLKTIGEIIDWCKKEYRSIPAEGFLGTLAKLHEDLEKAEKAKSAREAKIAVEVGKARLKAVEEAYKRAEEHPCCKNCVENLVKSINRRKFIDHEFYWTEDEEGIGAYLCSCDVTFFHPDVTRKAMDYTFGFWDEKFYIKKTEGL